MTFSSKFRTLLFAVASSLHAHAACHAANAGVFVSIGIAPPALPCMCSHAPAPLHLDSGYCPTATPAISGAWCVVNPPRVGVLWTQATGIRRRLYGCTAATGSHVGFYGGVNYGFGYAASASSAASGGRSLCVQQRVANFGGVHVTNVYENRTVIQQNTIINNNHVSYNGGAGIQAHASPGDAGGQ